MKLPACAALLLLVFVSSPAFPQDGRPLILEHANVINPQSDVPALNQTIVLRDGKIQSISSAPATMPGERIDLRGAWVLPGLIDAHVHLESIAAAQRMLSLGITTGRSMLTRGYAEAAAGLLR